MMMLLLLILILDAVTALSTTPRNDIVILGGSGRIGTAIATHLIRRAGDDLLLPSLSPSGKIILVGRNAQQGQDAVQEVLDATSQFSSSIPVEFRCISDVWDSSQLTKLFSNAAAVMHTAGPYQNKYPIPLKTAIEQEVPVYVDVSDPLEYLDASLKLNDAATSSGTCALLAAGAFPGLSNLLAMEAADSLPAGCQVEDVGFNYFTAGLGGSGDVNLYITNLGFGDEMPQYENGKLKYFKSLTGKLLGEVDFYTESTMARRVGSKQVFSWPFPEAATVARELKITGRSHACMGTAPDAWNVMLGLLVDIVPRSWWRSEKFSQFMADFSQPLVKATDKWLQFTSPDGVGETHAMRIDVTARAPDNKNDVLVSTIVQGHESFRQCVAQSSAEYCINLLQSQAQTREGGVQLVEQRYCNREMRKQLIEKMTTTPGTIEYSGPIITKKSDTDATVGPTRLKEVLKDVN
jgi:saccharopine dehydrogenase-like NADP-dependent oxidoreductase